MPTITNTVEDDIVKQISAEMGIPYSVVKDVVFNGQSAFTKHIIESGGYNSVRWPRLGTFKLKHKYRLLKRHMMGMSPIYKKMYREQIKNKLVFKNQE